MYEEEDILRGWCEIKKQDFEITIADPTKMAYTNLEFKSFDSSLIAIETKYHVIKYDNVSKAINFYTCAAGTNKQNQCTSTNASFACTLTTPKIKCSYNESSYTSTFISW